VTQAIAILNAMSRLRRANSRKVAAVTGIKPDCANVVLRRLTKAGRLRIVGVDMTFPNYKPFVYEVV
jgi:hypothetical protein